MPEWMAFPLAVLAFVGWSALMFCAGLGWERVAWLRGKDWRAAEAHRVALDVRARRVVDAKRRQEEEVQDGRGPDRRSPRPAPGERRLVPPP